MSPQHCSLISVEYSTLTHRKGISSNYSCNTTIILKCISRPASFLEMEFLIRNWRCLICCKICCNTCFRFCDKMKYHRGICFCLRESDHVPKMMGNKDFKTYAFFPQKDWPRQDSNLQSPVPKSGALSIRPHGLIPVDCSSLTHRKYIKQMGLQYTEDSLMERLASRWLWERWPCLFFLGKGVSHQEL